jgi:hypothetical protein
MNRIILLLAMMLSGMASFAQHPLVPGYMVVNSGDTLRGFIKLRGHATAPDGITFSKESQGPGVHYSIENCSAFGTNDELYLRRAVKMDMSVMNKLDFRIHYQDSTLLDTVFLKRVYAGKTYSLFKYFDGNESGFLQEDKKKIHYFLFDGEQMRELVINFVDPTKNNKSMTYAELAIGANDQRTTRPFYREQLSVYFDPKKERVLKRKLQGLEYEERPLMKFIALMDSKQK